MSPQYATIDGMEELFELNRLFLISLGRDLESGARRFGLPRAAVAAYRAAATELIEGLAEFPQPLFELDLSHLGAPAVMDPGGSIDPVDCALNLTVLVTAWNMSRKNDYGARLFLCLSDAEIRALRTTPLSDLPPLSRSAALIRCAYRDSPWLWHELLTEARPEYRRRLLLLGLQPRSELNGNAGRARLSATL